MTSDTNSERGRPRDEERTAAILEATHEVMHTKGWNDLTMGDIAKQAGCGLATIYRRWPTKEDLVAAAMLERPLPVTEETGDARFDLEALLLAMGAEMHQMGEAIIGFIAATQSDPVLRAAFAESVLADARPRIGRLLTNLLGADNAHVELLIDAIVGSLMMRSGVFGTLDSVETWTAEVLELLDSLR